MDIKKSITGALCAFALTGAMFAGPAAATEQPFAALQGIEAQALSAGEMDAIHGAITISQIRVAYVRALDRALAAGAITQARYDGFILRFDTVLTPLLSRVFQP